MDAGRRDFEYDGRCDGEKKRRRGRGRGRKPEVVERRRERERHRGKSPAQPDFFQTALGRGRHGEGPRLLVSVT